MTYFICTVQRSGSNLLCEALTRTGVAGKPTEYFTPWFVDADALGQIYAGFERSRWALDRSARSLPDFLRAAQAEGSTSNHVFGAKLMWNGIGDFLHKLAEMPEYSSLAPAERLIRAFPEPKFIRLRRRDQVRQAVSWALTSQTGHYRVHEEELRPALREPAFDLELIDGMHRSILEGEAGWTSFFNEAGIVPLELYFEDMVTDLRATVLNVLDWIGVAVPDFDLLSLEHQPQTTPLNAEWTERYRAARPGTPNGAPLLLDLQHGLSGAPSNPESQFIADYELSKGDRGVDQAWYLRTYPDIAAAGMDPVEHYLQFGWREGRDPRPDFSTSRYLEANQQVEGNPLLCYLRNGEMKVPSDFAADCELAKGDRGVDQAWYLRTYPDIAAAGMDPVEHYLQFGWREGRDPRPDFSTSGYLAANQQAEGNALLCYLRNGGTKVPSYFATAHDLANGTSLGAPALSENGSVNPEPSCAGLKQRFHGLLGKVARTIRAEAWWDHKLVPVLSVFYATACVQQVSIASIWLAGGALLIAIVPCATYVSLINDWTDRGDDHLAGKPNGMAGRPVWQMTLLLAAPLCVAVFFSVLWRDDLPLVAAYLGSWAVFSLYSVPPIRLKTRGVLGVIADACGSHVFPVLTAALLAQRTAGHPVDPVWIGALVAWSFGFGLRGILWHQLSDIEADRKATVRTFVVRHSPRAAARLALAALLIELIGLATLLWQSHSLWAVLPLLIYAAFATLKSRLWNIATVIAAPRGRHSVLGQEYYTLLLPLGLLLTSALRFPLDWAVLIAHCIVFPRPAMAFIRETLLLAQSSLNSEHRNHHAKAGPAKPPATALDTAIARAAAFLRERLRSGSYGLAAVGSDGSPNFSDNKGHVFVVSFMVEAMTGLFDEIDRTIVLIRILSEENGGLWGYAPPGLRHSEETNVYHVDSDDSAYVIRTLQRLGVNRPPQCLMRFYRETERLFVTWDTPGPTSLTAENALRNNFLAHPEVNANVFLALRGTHFDQFINYDMLLQAQDVRGFWKSYFYPSPLYATLLILDLTRGHPAFVMATARAVSFIAASQNADGSWGADGDPCETALAVAALAGHPAYAAATRRGVAHLLSTMAEDGSWASGACVWESPYNEQDLWRGYDAHRAYVSARCLIALRRAAGQIAPP